MVDAYEEAMKLFPLAESPRHRIEHCGLLTKNLIERIAKLGLVVVSQPRFISELGDGFRAALGDDRLKLCYPLASLLKSGVHLAGSSDRPVVRGAPLLGMHDCVNEKTRSGSSYAPQEALTVTEALSIFTLGSAYAEKTEKRKGMLKPGFLCDLVVLNGDFLRTQALDELQVIHTVIGGRVYTMHSTSKL